MSEPLRIIVCLKQVPDPESPPSSFSIDTRAMTVVCTGVPPVISPFDENALELAVQLKEKHGGEVTVLSAGSKLAKAVNLKALAVGADRMVTIDDPALERDKVDSRQTAEVLAAAICTHISEYDLVLTGIQASDTNAGQVGQILASMLGIPVMSVVRKVEVSGEEVIAEKVLPDGCEVVKAGIPLLMTVSHEVGELRYPPLAAIKAAKSLPQLELTLADLSIEPGSGRTVEIVSLELPDRERRCQMIQGDDPEQLGEALATRLAEDRKLAGLG